MPTCRELDVSEYPSYLLPEPTSKHMKEKVVLIENEFYKKWVSLCVHICRIVTDVCGEAWAKDDPRAKYLQTSNYGRFAEAWLIMTSWPGNPWIPHESWEFDSTYRIMRV